MADDYQKPRNERTDAPHRTDRVKDRPRKAGKRPIDPAASTNRAAFGSILVRKTAAPSPLRFSHRRSPRQLPDCSLRSPSLPYFPRHYYCNCSGPRPAVSCTRRVGYVCQIASETLKHSLSIASIPSSRFTSVDRMTCYAELPSSFQPNEIDVTTPIRLRFDRRSNRYRP